MANRCPDCNRFVSLEAQDPEVESIEVDAEGRVTASVRLVCLCAECSTGLKGFTFDIDEGASDDFNEHIEEEGEHEPEISEEVADADDSLVKGRQHYGFELTAAITCCGKEFPFSYSDDIAAADMDELT